eukprot:TRINITY_DN75062_c0_g1_i1.p1 TRINITY_DN75062_c0_g1~~TRINITY_DN75062_c0_g1_i1.p1  ORF type:complete len:359 (-),score=70.46 TRINITY_DN75062_c0_g1_i1:146-1222(-)
MVSKSPGYMLSRCVSDSGPRGGLTSLYHTTVPETDKAAPDPFVLQFKPCNSRIVVDRPRAKRHFPEASQVEKPDGWSVPRYSTHVVAPELLDREALDPAGKRQLDKTHEHPPGWSVPRYAGPQVARYVSDPYSDFVRVSRGRKMKGYEAPGAEWAQATGRLPRSDSCPGASASSSSSAPGISKKPPGEEVPAGWNVPRYSPMFYKLQSQECSLECQAMGSHLAGVGDPHARQPHLPQSGKAPNNPLAVLKKAAIEASAKRAAEAGDGVDVPDGWKVPRYAAQPVAVKTHVPKQATVKADDMMKVDPRGRPACTTNVWWPMPKETADDAIKRGIAGEDYKRTALKEGRRLPSAAASTRR